MALLISRKFLCLLICSLNRPVWMFLRLIRTKTLTDDKRAWTFPAFAQYDILNVADVVPRVILVAFLLEPSHFKMTLYFDTPFAKSSIAHSSNRMGFVFEVNNLILPLVYSNTCCCFFVCNFCTLVGLALWQFLFLFVPLVFQIIIRITLAPILRL